MNVLEQFVKKWIEEEHLNDMELGAKIREWHWLISNKDD